MTISMLNPLVAFPPGVVLVDDFLGADNDPISTSIWDTNGNTGGGTIKRIVSNSLELVTGTTGGYDSNDTCAIRTDASFADPEIQFLDFEWRSTSVDQEMRIKFNMRASGGFDWWQDSSETCLELAVLPYEHTLQLWKCVNGSWTALSSTVTFTSAVGGNPSAGDKWNIALRHTGTHFQAFVWSASGSRPGSPTLSGAETEFASSNGRVGTACSNGYFAARSFRLGSVWRSV